MKKSYIWIIIIIVVGFSVSGLGYYLKWFEKKDVSAAGIPTTVAKKGDFEILLSEVGKLDALKSQTVTSKTQGKITKMVPEGTFVKESETIVWLDTSELEKQLSDLETAQKNEEQDLLKTEENQRLQKYQNDMSVEGGKISLENAKLDYSDATIKLAKNQRLYDAQVIPETTLEDAKLRVLSQKASVEKSELSLSQIEETRKSNLISAKIQISQAQSQLREAKRKVDEMKQKIKDSVIIAPGNGIIVYEVMWRGTDRTKIQEGDQVWQQMAVAQLPDLSLMINKFMIDEIDISKVKIGQEIRIKLDALPGAVLSGKISRIATLATDKGAGDAPFWMRREASGVKAFEVTADVQANPHPLRPGMTTKSEVIIERFSNVITIPREGVIEKGAKKFVYLDTPRGLKEQEVKVGKGDSNYVIVESGLSGNEKIFLRNPTKQLKESTQDAKDKKEKGRDKSSPSSPGMPSVPAGPGGRR